MSSSSPTPETKRASLEIPELAPSLGRVIVPRRLAEPWIPLDDIREALATQVFACAGKARAAGHTVELAVPALGRAQWSGAWEQAVHRVADRLVEALDREIELAARRVRMPRHRWKRLRLTGSERRAVAARLASGGSRFVEALDEVEASGVALRRSGTGEVLVLEGWRDALLTAARRLEAAWLALEEQVAAERDRWGPELAAIEDWQPSVWPVFVIWIPVWAALIWLGLVLGGYLPAPLWLAARLGF